MQYVVYRRTVENVSAMTLNAKCLLHVLSNCFRYPLMLQSCKFNFEQDRQCRCDVTLRHVRATIVSIEQQ